MVCPFCQKENKVSFLTVGHSSSTLLSYPSYYNEKGDYISNDPNTHTTEYKCSNKHEFTVSRRMGEETISEDYDKESN